MAVTPLEVRDDFGWFSSDLLYYPFVLMYAIRKKITTIAYMLQLRKAKLIGMKGSLLKSKIKKDTKSVPFQMV